ncbi:MAG: hypothetical protein IJE14_05225 [Clostridia bacterium]|nr:hypothetical protein [Clostridia bacterium]
MEQFIVDQIKYGLKYLPVNALKAKLISSSSSETVCMREKHGFIRGICHPNENYEQIKNADIGWVRFDIPYPFDENGSIRGCFYDFKERCRGYAENGIKVMAVSPNPKEFIAAGVDVTDKANDEKVAEVSRFMINELRDVIGGVQVANEMGLPIFTLPVTLRQAAHFMGVTLKAMSEIRGDIIIGYNSTSPQADLHLLMKPYHRYCDYVGMDIYMGCFFNFPGFMWCFDTLLDYLWAYTGKPILLQEFGYISGGAAKSPEEKKAILRRYGADSEEEAKQNIESFVNALPERLAEQVKLRSHGNVERYADVLFNSDLVNHLYTELPKYTKIPGCEHTPEGQAKFYCEILPRLYRKKYLVGAMIYCYSDSPMCYVCGQNECPTETRWGIVDCDGKEKPSYYAVKEAFGKIAAESPVINFNGEK